MNGQYVIEKDLGTFVLLRKYGNVDGPVTKMSKVALCDHILSICNAGSFHNGYNTDGELVKVIYFRQGMTENGGCNLM